MSEAIHVWRCDLDGGHASHDVLDDGERARAARFAFEHLRRRYVAAHVFLRSVLGAALGVRSESLVFAAAEHGKPYLVGYDLAFNLSHSASTAYLVLGGTEPIGIDVELPHVIEDLMSVARSVFSHREIGEIESATEEARAGLFLRCWTRKEAYVKALGVGLGARLSDITVGSAREDVVVPATFGISEKSFHVRTLEAPFGEHAAIATMSPPAGVAVRDFRLT